MYWLLFPLLPAAVLLSAIRFRIVRDRYEANVMVLLDNDFDRLEVLLYQRKFYYQKYERLKRKIEVAIRQKAFPSQRTTFLFFLLAFFGLPTKYIWNAKERYLLGIRKGYTGQKHITDALMLPRRKRKLQAMYFRELEQLVRL